MTGSRSLWPLWLAAACGFILLCGLGFWQVQRLAAKEAQLAAIAARARAQPIGLAELAARRMKGEDVAYFRVHLTGTYLGEQTKPMIATFGGGPGFELVTPLLAADGLAILVDRGAIPLPFEARWQAREEAALVAVVRPLAGRQGMFDPDNDVAGNRWYWWDLKAMMAATALPEGATLVPLIVRAETPGKDGLPRPAPLASGLRNNHLGYAITWFSLAAALLGVTLVFARSEAGKPRA